jgi:methylthioxylose transferase
LATSVTRTYAYYLFGAPTAWAVMLGLPTLWFGLRALGTRDRAAVAVAAVIVVASVLGFTREETERIWLPFTPLACVAAAAVVPVSRLRPVLTILAVQALAVDVLLFTVW